MRRRTVVLLVGAFPIVLGVAGLLAGVWTGDMRWTWSGLLALGVIPALCVLGAALSIAEITDPKQDQDGGDRG